MKLTVYLLVLLVTRHVVWGLMHPGDQGRVWNMLGAVVFIGLLLVIWASWVNAAPWPMTIVCGWWAYEEMLVAGCSAWHLLDPWIVGPGEEMCSARLGFRLGMHSLVSIFFIATFLLDRLRRQRAPGNSITGK